MRELMEESKVISLIILVQTIRINIYRENKVIWQDHLSQCQDHLEIGMIFLKFVVLNSNRISQLISLNFTVELDSIQCLPSTKSLSCRLWISKRWRFWKSKKQNIKIWKVNLKKWGSSWRNVCSFKIISMRNISKIQWSLESERKAWRINWKRKLVRFKSCWKNSKIIEIWTAIIWGMTVTRCFKKLLNSHIKCLF